MRDYDLLVPMSVESLTAERHAEARDDYARDADAWREEWIRKHGITPPPAPR